jgi:hypothetical protein
MPLVSKAFGDIITFTRASSATFTGSNGLIQSAAINAPRFDYDPVTLAAKGLLIEEQRTNLLTYSEDFSNAVWTKLRATVTANSTTSPDGTATADTLLDTAVAGTHIAIQTITKAASAITYAASVWVKADVRNQGELRMSDQAGNGVRCTFNLTTGAVGAATSFGAGFTAVTSQITAFANGWYLVVLVATSNTATTLGHEVYVADASGNTSYTGTGAGIFIWGAQLEAGAFATSYIPTVASQVTRSADVASVNTLSPWYNATEGTLYVEGSTLALASSHRIIAAFSDNTVSNTFELYRQANSATSRLYMAASGVLQADLLFASVFNAGTNAKIAAAYKVNDVAMTANAAAVQTDVTATVPVFTALGIGTRGTPGALIWGGHIRRITYYPRRLSNAELQAITA